MDKQMKKIILILVIVASLTAVSCMKDEAAVSVPDGNEGGRMQLIGSVDSDTKLSVGNKEDGVYRLLWNSCDLIAIFSSDVVHNEATGEYSGRIAGELAELYDEDNGKRSGRFRSYNAVETDEAVDLLITYPGKSLVYSEGTVSGTVPAVQEQQDRDSSGGLGKYAVAFAKSSLAAGQTEGVQFNLEQQTAFVKLRLSTSSYSELRLISASLMCRGAALAGQMAVNTASGEAVYSGTSDCVTVKYSAPTEFAGIHELYFAALPCDLSGKDCYVIVEMGDDSRTVTVPIKVKGGELRKSALSVISIADISEHSNTVSWYEPEETRYLADGWSYGEANTFMIAPDGSSKTISVKARGRFSGCQEPKYAKILYGCHLNANDYPLLIDGKSNKVGAADYQEYVEIGEDCAIEVTAKKCGTREGYSGKIALYNAEKEMLWAFTIWGVAAVEEHQYKSALVMDRNLGQGYAPDNDSGSHAGLYFQWGRPFCFSWPGGLFPKEATTATDLGVSASKADKFLFYQGVSNSGLDWYLGAQTGSRSDRKDDLWGNPNRTDGDEGSPEKGVKSIFDPCPKGWMVISPTVAKEVMNNVFEHRKGTNVRWVVYKYDGEHEALYPYTGCKWGETAGNSTNNINDIAGYWTNSPFTSYEGSNQGAYCMYFRYRNEQLESTTKNGRANGFMVRCMKDEENR